MRQLLFQEASEPGIVYLGEFEWQSMLREEHLPAVDLDFEKLGPICCYRDVAWVLEVHLDL